MSGNGRYSEGANTALFHATEEAKRLMSGYIGTEHLLLGIFLSGENEISSVLKQIPVGRIRTDLERTARQSQVAHQQPILGYSPRAHLAVTVLAPKEADSLGHSEIRIGHLLLAVLKLEGSKALAALRNERVQLSVLRQDILSAMGAYSAPPLAHAVYDFSEAAGFHLSDLDQLQRAQLLYQLSAWARAVLMRRPTDQQLIGQDEKQLRLTLQALVTAGAELASASENGRL